MKLLIFAELLFVTRLVNRSEPGFTHFRLALPNEFD